MDTDQDGQISLEEFKAGVKKHPQLVEMFLAPARRLSATKIPAGVLDAAAAAAGGAGAAEAKAP